MLLVFGTATMDIIQILSLYVAIFVSFTHVDAQTLFMSSFPVTKSNVCNVLDYGAKGDNQTDDTVAIQSAFNQCSTNSVIYFPSNYIFKSFPLQLNGSNLTIAIDTHSQLTAMPDIKNWPVENSSQTYKTFLSIDESHNIKLIGNGIINGNGQIWWPKYKSNNLTYRRPNLIDFSKNYNIHIENITLINSPMFHVDLDNNTNVFITGLNITVTSPGYSNAPNTDGIDIGSNNVLIKDCFIANGDDSYVLKPNGRNVIVENSIAKYGLGLDIGTGALPVIRNVTFKNMILNQTGYGIRLKSHYYENGTMEDIKFINITMINVEDAIDINQFNEGLLYMQKQNWKNVNDSNMSNTNRLDKSGLSTSSQNFGFTAMHNVSFVNISGTYSSYAGSLHCSSTVPCNGLLFENIQLMATNKHSINWTCDNVHGVAKNVKPDLTCLNSN